MIKKQPDPYRIGLACELSLRRVILIKELFSLFIYRVWQSPKRHE